MFDYKKSGLEYLRFKLAETIWKSKFKEDAIEKKFTIRHNSDKNFG